MLGFAAQPQQLTLVHQTYGWIDGDSASLAELLALLSAIAEQPIAQGIAVTGSVDQHGHVQAVGGLHEKVEGFFDVCTARGLSGAQGVVIPRVSAGRLMQRADVVASVEAGKFHVYAVDSVDQAIPIVMGRTAAERGPDGLFPPDCVNDRVEARLQEFAALAVAALGDKKPTETQS